MDRLTLYWIRILSLSWIAVGLLGLLLLTLQGTHAAEKVPSLPPPKLKASKSATLPNPFAQPTSPTKVQVHKPGKQPIDPEDVPEPVFSSSGIQVGGSLPSGVKDQTQTPISALKVDDDSGKGSDAVITDFNYPDADIMDLAKTIGKLTGKNFIFDKNVKGRISIVSNSPITVGDAWRSFLTALDINGFALIPSGSHIRIARQRDARDKQISTYLGNSPDTDALITRVFPLKYISAEEVAKTFRSFIAPTSRIIPYEQTNTVIVTDTGANIAKLAKMLEILDVEGFDAGIEVIAVHFASASEIAKLVDSLLPGTSSGTGPSGRIRPGGARSGFVARRTKEGGVVNNIIADERTNALIVHANKKGVEEVKMLVKKLDQKQPAMQGGGKIHVVYLQFADAEELAKTLNTLGQGNAKTGTTRNSRTAAPVAEATLFEGNIKVSADKATNSLVVTASPSDFVTVQRVIQKLDIPRDEVYAEVVIMEMTVGKNFEFSTAAALPDKGIGFDPNGDLAKFLVSPLSQTGMVLGFKKGNVKKITDNATGKSIEVHDVNGLIKALQTNQNANVIATPQILTLDNVEAKFESNERIPIQNKSVTQTGTDIITSRESIGLSLSLKPQINKISNFVKLEIKAKLEDFVDRATQQTIERKAETQVVVADSDTVVMGGLIRDSTNNTVKKIPILGDIPLLGWLFSARNNISQKTNLMIFITPHIIRQYEKMRALLDEKLKERDQFIEKHAGGEDGLRDYRDEMIRKLPDIKEVLKETQSAGSRRYDADLSPGGGNTSSQPFTGDSDEAIKEPDPASKAEPAEDNESDEESDD